MKGIKVLSDKMSIKALKTVLMMKSQQADCDANERQMQLYPRVMLHTEQVSVNIIMAHEKH